MHACEKSVNRDLDFLTPCQVGLFCVIAGQFVNSNVRCSVFLIISYRCWGIFVTVSWQHMKILGCTAFLPERLITNQDVVQACFVEKTPAEQELDAARISRQTGILTRRYASSHCSTSDLAASALSPLLPLFSLQQPLYGVIVATTSPDVPSPATANWLHRKCHLAPSVQAFDVASSCSSSLSALRAAAGFVAGGQACAVVAAELKHKGLNPQDIRTRALFGDGAAALVLAPSQGEEGFLFDYVQVNSELAERIRIPVGGTQEPLTTENMHRIYLEIQEPKNTYHATVKAFVEALESLWATREQVILRAGQNPRDVGGVIYLHQANANIIRDVKARLPQDLARRIPLLMSDVGNMVCASLCAARCRSRFLEDAVLKWSLKMPRSQIGSDFLRQQVHIESGLPQLVLNEWLTVVDAASSTSTPSKAGSKIQSASHTPLNNSWVQELQDEELESVITATFEGRLASNNQPYHSFVDVWVAAGGGFQTLGCLHAKNLELK